MRLPVLKEADPLWAAALKEARATWPGISVSAATFIEYLTARQLASQPLEEWLGARDIGDLYLACGCFEGDRQALAAFEQTYMTDLPLFLSHMNLRSEELDEIGQTLRERLFLSPRAKIGEYTGRGPLRAWLRVVATRTALNHRRTARRRKEQPTDVEETAISSPGDPELDYIKTRYGRDFTDAFKQAMDDLTGQERNLLRLHFVEGLSVPKIGVIYGVHRATMARRIAALRRRILVETRRLLRERLGLSPTEFHSLLGVVRSRIHLSLRYYFAQAETQP